MGLSERKEKIIKAVVDSYIDKAQPVSSADIRQSHLPSLSTATIRNELASLEEMGYLDQPHTSAGRVPTADAYRLYVEKLMPARKITPSEIAVIRKYFDHKITEIDDMLRSTAKVISEVTHLTGIAYVSGVADAVVRNVRIVKITPTDALVVIVTDLGVLKDSMLSTSEEVPEEYFTKASEFVTRSFAGHSIGEICSGDELIERITGDYRKVFDFIVEIMKKYMAEENRSVVLEGGSRMLDQPEYSDVESAKKMFALLESKETLIDVAKGSGGIGLSINIAPCSDDDSKPECAVVTANLTRGGLNIGKAGVIGPIRMDYPRIVSVLEYIEKTVDKLSAADPAENGKRGGKKE